MSRSLYWNDVLVKFLESRRPGTAPGTIRDYRITLGKSLPKLGLAPTAQRINDFLLNLTCTLGGKYGYFKCIRAFYNWLYSPRADFGFKSENNPVTWVEAPKRPYLILPSLSQEQVFILLDRTKKTRDRAIIAVLAESGLRVSEIAQITLKDIDWVSGTIRIMGKGSKEALAPFGPLSRQYLTQWLAQFQPNSNIWGINKWGITSMLRQLEKETNIPCNPHVFRRTFACLLRKAGVDTMTIKDLGRWESMEMVQRYTRSFSFNDALKHYKPPLG
jgi:site-specific recombinase XerD